MSIGGPHEVLPSHGAELGQERGDLGRCDREGGFGACPTTRPGW